MFTVSARALQSSRDAAAIHRTLAGKGLETGMHTAISV